MEWNERLWNQIYIASLEPRDVGEPSGHGPAQFQAEVAAQRAGALAPGDQGQPGDDGVVLSAEQDDERVGTVRVIGVDHEHAGDQRHPEPDTERGDDVVDAPSHAAASAGNGGG